MTNTIPDVCSTTGRSLSYDQVRAALAEREIEVYTMSVVGDDATAVAQAVDRGIDSHLEACYVPSRGDRYEPADRRIDPKDPDSPVVTRALDCEVSAESLPVLLRRLMEQGIEAENLAYESGRPLDDNPSCDLAGSIVYSLGFE